MFKMKMMLKKLKSRKGVFFSVVAVMLVAIMMIAFIASNSSRPYSTKIPTLNTQVTSMVNLITNMKSYSGVVVRICAYKSLVQMSDYVEDNDYYSDQTVFMADFQTRVRPCINEYEQNIKMFRKPMGVEVNFDIKEDQVSMILNNSYSIRVNSFVEYNLTSAEISFDNTVADVEEYVYIFGIKDPFLAKNGVERYFSNELDEEFYLNYEGRVIFKETGLRWANTIEESVTDPRDASVVYDYVQMAKDEQTYVPNFKGPSFIERYYVDWWYANQPTKTELLGLFSYVNGQEDYLAYAPTS